MQSARASSTGTRTCFGIGFSCYLPIPPGWPGARCHQLERAVPAGLREQPPSRQIESTYPGSPRLARYYNPALCRHGGNPGIDRADLSLSIKPPIRTFLRYYCGRSLYFLRFFSYASDQTRLMHVVIQRRKPRSPRYPKRSSPTTRTPIIEASFEIIRRDFTNSRDTPRFTTLTRP